MTQESKDAMKARIIIFFLPVLSTILAFLGYKTVSTILFLVWFIPYFLLFLFARKLKEYTDRKIEETKREKERIEAELHPAEGERAAE